mgnify:FL=1
MKLVIICILALLSNDVPAQDFDSCAEALPVTASTAISRELNEQWRLVTEKDLPSDDRKLWNNNHPGKCPGVSVGQFRGKGTKSYAVALLQGTAPGKYIEQLILLDPKGNHVSRTPVVEPTRVTTPFVVWTVAPGKYKVADDGRSDRKSGG